MSLSRRSIPAARGEVPPGGNEGGDLTRSDSSAAKSFAILWRELADILGTAGAASLVRRAAQRVMPRWPELAEFFVTRDSLEYRYALPPNWNDPSPNPPEALRELVRELWKLLIELTGAVVVNRLAKIPELRDSGIVPEQEKES